MTTRFERFTARARQGLQERFTALMGLLFDPEGLRESFERQDGRKAPGVDGIRKDDYGEGLDTRLENLSARIRTAWATGHNRRGAPTFPKGMAATGR